MTQSAASKLLMVTGTNNQLVTSVADSVSEIAHLVNNFKTAGEIFDDILIAVRSAEASLPDGASKLAKVLSVMGTIYSESVDHWPELQELFKDTISTLVSLLNNVKVAGQWLKSMISSIRVKVMEMIESIKEFWNEFWDQDDTVHTPA